uniref:Putative lipocalin-2 1 n=1 Tax=Amblyomma parvum TaxID=251391 RepID=A0A023G1T1_AMBPA
MGCLIATALSIANFVLVCADSQYRGVSRMAVHEDYFQYQNISKALNTPDIHWFYGSNYDIDQSDEKCIYFKFQNVSKDSIDFYSVFAKNSESGEGSGSESMVAKVASQEKQERVNYTGSFYALPMIALNGSKVERNTSNALYITSPDAGEKVTHAKNFSLIYHKPGECLIFLVLSNTNNIVEQWPNNLDQYENKCIILLTDSAARKGIIGTHSRTNWCQNMFHSACLKYDNKILRTRFNNSCRSPEVAPLPAC